MNPHTLLVVEDEAIVAADLAEKLTQLGYQVLAITARGDEAVTLALTLKPDLVLMDIRLQGSIDGIVAAEQIHSRCDIPIVFLTAHSDPRTLERAKITESFGYILKPFEERELHTVVEIALHRHQAERLLRESEQRYRSLFEYNLDAIFSLDAQGRFVTANPAAERLSGYTTEELKERHFLELCVPELREVAKDSFRDAFCRQCRDLELSMSRKDGARRDLFVTGAPVVVDGEVVGASCLARDITERKHLENQLIEADRKKDEFIATLAHELRNPLGPILNAVAVLRQEGLEERSLSWCRDVIERQVGQMAHLLDDLLDVSRITSGKLSLSLERLELAAVLDRAREATKTLIEDHHHKLTVSLPLEPIWLDADPVRLVQVFSNLLTNAAKYTEKGGHIQVAAERCGNEIAVSVKDTGIGIAAKHLPHIFDMFSQVESALNRSHGGLGIGLSLTRNLVETHGGRITARSDGPSLGSEFVVRLPLIETSSAVARPQGTERAMPATKLYRILVADDNRDCAESLALMLELDGHEIRIANDGVEAMQVAESFRPDVAILDIGMPKLNGYEACRGIREQPWGKNMILIALTGWDQDKDKQKTQEVGFNYHLVKPVA